MKLAVFLAVALLAASASASFTGHWHSKPFTTAPSPKTAAGYKAAFEALPDLGVTGYCSTPITNFAQFSNPILCPGNANSDYAAQLTVSFTTEVAEQFCFRYGVDSTYGGVISIDGNVLYQQYTDMWWAGNWNSNGVFEGCMHLAAGAHTFTGYVFESCCGGSSRLEVKIGTGEYMPVSGSLDLPETEAPVGFEDNTPTVGEVEEGFASIIVDTNAAGKVFCAAVPAGSAVPTHNQISMPEWWGAIGQTSAETDGSSAVLILFGLQAGTDYDLYCTTESENQHAPLSEEGILATKRSFSTKLCPESTLTSHSAAYYHSRHLPTGTPVPTDGLGKKALFDSLVDGVTGYCKFDFTAPLAGITNARACGSNSDIAFKVSYTLQITTAGDYDFVVGPDFGLGSTVIADGVAVANTNDDLWWQNDVNNADTLRFTINFAVGEHTLEIYGFEQCCDGGLSLFGAHSGETLTILGSNDEFPIEIPLMFEDIHIGTIAENTVMIKADLNREASIYCSAFYANDDFVPTFSDLLLGTAFSRHTVSASAPFCDENSSVCLAVTGLRECVTYDIYCAARDVNGYFTEVTSAGRHRVKTECHVEDFIAECDSCKSGLVTVGTDEYHSVSLSFNNDGTYNTDCT